MATSVVTGSPLLVLRVVVDHAYFFLSPEKETIDLQNGKLVCTCTASSGACILYTWVHV